MASSPPSKTVLDLSESEAGEENYHSASDGDFDPTTAPAYDDVDAISSSNEGEAITLKPSSSSKRKHTAENNGLELDFSNSGDEGIIKKGRRKSKKSGRLGEDEDEGGEGGLIKTRAQRRVEQVERKPLASAATATVDVDKLWAELNSIPVGKSIPPPRTGTQKGTHESNGVETASEPAKAPAKISTDEEMITISRTYAFAGEKTTEVKRVPKSSAEAQLWLSQQGSKGTAVSVPGIDPTTPPLRRPLKRRSMFDDEPSIVGAANGSRKAEAKAGKLTTVEKSKLDWAGYVDKEGIAEELGEQKKGKTGYLNRMDFLGRVENRKEEELRAAKGI